MKDKNTNPDFPSISIHGVNAEMISVSVNRYEMGFATVEINIGAMSLTLFTETHEDGHAVADALSKYTSEAR